LQRLSKQLIVIRLSWHSRGVRLLQPAERGLDDLSSLSFASPPPSCQPSWSATRCGCGPGRCCMCHRRCLACLYPLFGDENLSLRAEIWLCVPCLLHLITVFNDGLYSIVLCDAPLVCLCGESLFHLFAPQLAPQLVACVMCNLVSYGVTTISWFFKNVGHFSAIVGHSSHWLMSSTDAPLIKAHDTVTPKPWTGFLNMPHPPPSTNFARSFMHWAHAFRRPEKCKRVWPFCS